MSLPHHILKHLVLGSLGSPDRLAGFDLRSPGLDDRLKTQRTLAFAGLIEQTNEIDSPHILAASMVIVSGYQPILIGVGLVSDAVIGEQDAVWLLNLPDEWFDVLPQGAIISFESIQQISDRIVPHGSVHEPGEAGSGSLAEATEQVVSVEVKSSLHTQI
jgi:hypothetical protein